MGMCAGRVAGNPAAAAIGHRDAAVERGRQLERNMRAAVDDAANETGQTGACFGRHRIAFDHNARSFEPVKTLACGAGIGVSQRADDSRGLGGDQAVGASWSTRAFMRTRFKADIDCRACRSASRLLQRDRFCMRAATGLCPTAPDDDAILDDDTADRGVVTR